VAVPFRNGDLYFTVESYYPDLVPSACTTGDFTYTTGGEEQTITATSPLAYIGLYKNTDLVNVVTYRYYFESFAMPIKVEEADYNNGDVFTLKVKYLWFGSPEPDYTVKVYSKQNLAIRDSDGVTNEIHMDGQCPSGFTDSTY